MHAARPAYAKIVRFDLLIGVAWWLTFNVLREPWSWALLGGLHLALPFLAHHHAGRHAARRGFLAGPGLVLGVYLLLLVRYIFEIVGGPDDHGAWLGLLVAFACAVVIAVLALYSVLVTAYLQRRARRRT